VAKEAGFDIEHDSLPHAWPVVERREAFECFVDAEVTTDRGIMGLVEDSVTHRARGKVEARGNRWRGGIPKKVIVQEVARKEAISSAFTSSLILGIVGSTEVECGKERVGEGWIR
jgi:hypothetical protein